MDDIRERVLLAAARWVDAFKRLDRAQEEQREPALADRAEMTNAEVELCDMVAAWRQTLHGPLGGRSGSETPDPSRAEPLATRRTG
jgi:hypothetical protein